MKFSKFSLVGRSRRIINFLRENYSENYLRVGTYLRSSSLVAGAVPMWGISPKGTVVDTEVAALGTSVGGIVRASVSAEWAIIARRGSWYWLSEYFLFFVVDFLPPVAAGIFW